MGINEINSVDLQNVPSGVPSYFFIKQALNISKVTKLVTFKTTKLVTFKISRASVLS